MCRQIDRTGALQNVAIKSKIVNEEISGKCWFFNGQTEQAASKRVYMMTRTEPSVVSGRRFSMQTGSPMGTAQIIPFPVRGRLAQGNSDAGCTSNAAAMAIVYDAAFASSWYHEDALHDGPQGQKS
jgi:hypothetical protein